MKLSDLLKDIRNDESYCRVNLTNIIAETINNLDTDEITWWHCKETQLIGMLCGSSIRVYTSPCNGICEVYTSYGTMVIGKERDSDFFNISKMIDMDMLNKLVDGVKLSIYTSFRVAKYSDVITNKQFKDILFGGLK